MNDKSEIVYTNETDNTELNEMLLDSESSHISEEKSEGLEKKSDAKVLVKTNSQSDEGGYGSVLGVVSVIISISFILAALFIRMLS